ncbi:MAG: hypothetical protein KJ620_08585 [Candidatus Edwardsbacteria bacterium]|nr:hypothetical protein [Candidatus Edwardsbacteria bacterium]MBU1576776.1 hypothetical protein [Candidatus Edwardsbacteria bacterium]MBU2464585.1 hypothetical protein [Candidatus Edwardsbacteria bacterium]MBU2593367.1 hypothetical protein [Candidatus Edwardsbacteria bacterium]
MPGLTYAQKSAFVQMMAQMLKDNLAGLKASGFDPSVKLTAMNAALKTSVEDDMKQEALKAELVKATDKATKSLDAAYVQASSLADAMVGVIGKNAPLALRIKQLRGQMVNEKARGKRTVRA